MDLVRVQLAMFDYSSESDSWESPRNGEGKGYGFITFKKLEEARMSLWDLPSLAVVGA